MAKAAQRCAAFSVRGYLSYGAAMNRVFKVLVIAACAGLLGTCSSVIATVGFEQNRDSIESWITGAPSRAWTPIEPGRRIDLPVQSVMPAAQLLYDREALQLNPDNFARLVPGRPWPSETGRVPYLLRGVALDEPQGTLKVLESGNDILVQYEGPQAKARAIPLPVIVLMPAAPTNLYVRISLFD
jgi:hypothetical protein